MRTFYFVDWRLLDNFGGELLRLRKCAAVKIPNEKIAAICDRRALAAGLIDFYVRHKLVKLNFSA